MAFKTLRDAGISGKNVLVRADFNVSIENGIVVEDSRIRLTMPTINFLLKAKASKIILMSHLGRPDGKILEELRMEPVAQRLQKLLKKEVVKLDDCINVKKQVENSKAQIILLENLRFYPEEEENDFSFAKKLAEPADLYVNDAFGASHRAHASVAAITKYLPSYAGLLLESELNELSSLFRPKRPFVVVLGGAKVSDKVGLIENLSKIADKILIGGAMDFTFLRAKGLKTGMSKVEDDRIAFAKKILNSKLASKIMLPVDFIVADRIGPKAKTQVVSADNIPDGWIGLDIGPETVKMFAREISFAKTIVWNGPLGYSEIGRFGTGTKKMGEAIAKSRAKTVVGGGDTLAAIEKYRLRGFSHVSTGGGAMLEFLEGRKLPAVAALEKN